MKLLDLFITSSVPVLKVLSITALGFCLALDNINILGEAARMHINQVIYYVLNPSLVATNLDRTITYNSMVKLWFMPVNILITFVLGSLLGWLLVQITRPPKHLRGLILGSCAAGNLGNLIMIIVPAACQEKGSPFGAPDVCNKYALAYASLSMAIGTIYTWLYVYNMLRVSSRRTQENDPNSGPLLAPDQTEAVHPDAYLLPRTTSQMKADQVEVSNSIMHRLQQCMTNINIKALFAPSTIGAIVGFIIGLVPQIRQSLVGNEAPLRVIQESASFLGEASIPCLTLIIGGNLLNGLRRSDMQKSVIVGIVVSRFVILPLVGIFIVRGARQIGFVHPDSLYQFVLLIQYAVPPAMNIGIITQMFGAGNDECSVILLWSNGLASISLTLWSTYFMWLVS